MLCRCGSTEQIFSEKDACSAGDLISLRNVEVYVLLLLLVRVVLCTGFLAHVSLPCTVANAAAGSRPQVKVYAQRLLRQTCT